MRKMELTDCNFWHTHKSFQKEYARLHKHISTILNTALGRVGGPESNTGLRAPLALNREVKENDYTDILSDLKNKSFYKIAHKIKKLTAPDQLNLELEWTDYLQRIVDYGNKYLLKSFRLRLIIEEV